MAVQSGRWVGGDVRGLLGQVRPEHPGLVEQGKSRDSTRKGLKQGMDVILSVFGNVTVEH